MTVRRALLRWLGYAANQTVLTSNPAPRRDWRITCPGTLPPNAMRPPKRNDLSAMRTHAACTKQRVATVGTHLGSIESMHSFDAQFLRVLHRS